MTPITIDTIQLKKIIYDTVSILLDEKLKKVASKKDLSYLPTKEDFYSKMDKWMKRVTDKQSEKISHTAQHDRLSKRVDKIEQHLGIGSI